jgi:eukaryotic-like serine/threonine-protein kinase
LHTVRQPVIAQKYRLLEQLGQGGMGSVWRAEHLLLRSQVAIKLISPELATSREGLSRFLREAQAAASLRSPHVVQILDYGVDEGTPYIAMELLEGESLGTRLSRVGRLTQREVGSLFVQLGRAIARAHDSGIIHRDLKPDNVFIVHNDEEEIAKVLDFGIAKLSTRAVDGPATGATRTGALLGTPYYMSPEQVEGASTLDCRSDVWAIGVIAYECLVGQKPFEAETMGGIVLAICTKPLPVPSQRAVVPTGFDEWFACACRRELDQRFASAREATRELKRICDEADGIPARSSSAEILPGADANREAQPDPYAVASSPPKSLPTFSSSQRSKPTHRFSSLQAWVIAGVVVVAVIASLTWMRAQSSSALQPTVPTSGFGAPMVSLPSAVPVASSRVVVAPVAPMEEPKAVSVESIPTAAPTEIPRVTAPKAPNSAAQLAAKPPAEAPKIILDESPSDNAAALPENPYKTGNGSVRKRADSPGF